MVSVAGFDLSLTATGVANWWGSDPSTKTIRGLDPKRHGNLGRLAQLSKACVDWARDCDAELCVIESPSFGSKTVRGFHERGGQWWMTLRDLQAAGFAHLAVVPPTTLKQFATGKGNATKTMMIDAAKTLKPDFRGDDNQADALWLAAMGATYMGQTDLPLTVARKHALTKACWDFAGKFSNQ